MARAIVRWSVQSETRNATGNAITRLLSEHGATKVGTAAYELDDPDEVFVLDVMCRVLMILQDSPGGGRLDHVWVYIDNSN